MIPEPQLRSGSEAEAPLPACSGVYFLCRKAEIIYVGKTSNIAGRIQSHRGIKDFDSVLVLRAPSELLDSVEVYWIKRLRPKLNLKSGHPQMNRVRIQVTLSPQMRDTLAEIARTKNKTQGECIEEALTQWMRHHARK